MLGKLLMAAGVAVTLIGGVIMAAIVTGTQLAQSGYSPSVQHYADQNASAGNPVALALVGIGAALLLAGLALTLVRRPSR
jgi:ABC-type Na+ efflux pump permease subunit